MTEEFEVTYTLRVLLTFLFSYLYIKMTQLEIHLTTGSTYLLRFQDFYFGHMQLFHIYFPPVYNTRKYYPDTCKPKVVLFVFSKHAD